MDRQLSISATDNTSPETRRANVRKAKGPTPVVRPSTVRRTVARAKPDASTRDILKRASRKEHYRFKYNQIKESEVRILTLERIEPGQPEDKVCVSLRTVPISELGTRHQYEALSYYWGEGKAEHPLYLRDTNALNVEKAEDAFWAVLQKHYVRPNLYIALQHLRQKDVDVDLWIDAICINQDNEEEKKAQVSRMWEIYNRATRVCIWLGPAEDRSDHAMKFITHIIKDLEEVENLVQDAEFTQQWHDLAQLLRRPWFSRRWVIQELALATDATVLCGYEETHWEDFKDAISLFICHLDMIRERFKQSKKFNNDFFAITDLDSLGAKVLVEVTGNIFRKDTEGELFESTAGLEYLVSTLCAFDSSDPRDTVLALRNMARETSRVAPTNGPRAVNPPPEPDYRKDLLEVYTDFVRWVVQTSNSLDIICRHWALPERNERPFGYPPLCKLPTWIQVMWEGTYGKPDSRRTGRINGDSFVGLPGRKLYDASHGRVPEYEFGVDRQRTPTSVTAPPSQITYTVPEGIALDPPEAEDTQVHVDAVKLSAIGRSDISSAAQVDATQLNGAHRDDTQLGNPQTNGSTHDSGSLNRPQVDDNQSYGVKFSGQRFTGQPHSVHVKSSENSGDCPDGASPSSTLSNDSTVIGEVHLQPDEAASTAAQHFLSAAASAGAHSITVSASTNSLSLEVSPKRDHSLYVRGLQIGRITWKSDPMPDGVIPQLCLQKAGWNAQEEVNRAPDKLWRTLVADRGPDGTLPPSHYHRACLHCLVRDTPNGHINTKDLLRKGQPSIVRDYLKRVQAVTWNRVFLEADVSPVGAGREKLFGLGPPKALYDDVVCVLFGCSVPVILRKAKDEEDEEYFEFVGEAYIYGKMDGEAVTGLTEEELAKQSTEFRLL